MGLGCSFVVKGETLDEVTREAMQHVQDKHAQDFNKMQSEVEIQRMELAIRKSTRVVAE
jgi:predicted small metal-binding protein